MRVRSLFFALYRDLAGAAELDVELPPGATAGTLVQALRSRGGAFERLPAEVAIAVNREYASLDAPLRDGDEVALIPPVAGG
jgi:molybdopterin converting factor subunit 1